jgi:hypothetical protein
MKKLIFAVAVFTSALTLAACFGPTREEIAAADDSTCGSMGLKFGSSEFAQCRMLLLQQREANAAQARQNAVNTINGYRDNVMNNQVPASVYAPPPMTPIGR